MTCAYMTAFNYSFYAPWTAELGHVDAMLTVANNVNGIVRDKINKQWHPLHSAQYVWTVSLASFVICNRLTLMPAWPLVQYLLVMSW